MRKENEKQGAVEMDADNKVKGIKPVTKKFIKKGCGCNCSWRVSLIDACETVVIVGLFFLTVVAILSPTIFTSIFD